MRVPYMNLGQQPAGTVVEVIMQGGEAFVEVLDDNNLGLLTQGQVHTYFGGPISGTFQCTLPSTGIWYVLGVATAGPTQAQIFTTAPTPNGARLPWAQDAQPIELQSGEVPDGTATAVDQQAPGELQGTASGLGGGKLGRRLDFKTDYISGDLEFPPGLSAQRRKAIEYAEKWADGNNTYYTTYAEDCTNFVSQALRAGGFEDRGDGWDDWHHGDRDDWYYKKGSINPWNRDSETWYNAAASHDYFTQHSGLGEIKGVLDTPVKTGLDPRAPSKVGLVPGDLIYYKDNTGSIEHVAMYVGQVDGVDVVDQHSGKYSKPHDDWMPDTPLFLGGQSRVEFVHVKYPDE